MDFNIVNNNTFKQGNFNLRINPEGVDTETHFESNPVMLYNHNRNRVIGKWNDVTLSDGRIVGKPEFASDEFSKDIEQKLEGEFINSVSPGLEILETSYDEDEDVLTVEKSVLLEVSMVPIPANPENRKVDFSKENVLLLSDDNKEVNINNLVNNKKSQIMSEENKQKTLEDIKAEKLELSSKVENFEKQVEDLNSKVEEKDNELQEKDNKIAELENQVVQFNKEKMENLIDSAVAEGKISEESKSEFMELSYKKAQSILDKLSNDGSLSLSKQMEGKKETEHKDYEYYLKNDKEGLMQLEKENPELYKKLEKEYSEKFNK